MRQFWGKHLAGDEAHAVVVSVEHPAWQVFRFDRFGGAIVWGKDVQP